MESIHTTEPQEKIVGASATKLGEPIQQAIPLLPPFQPSEARPDYPGWREYQRSASQSESSADIQGVKIPPVNKNLAYLFFFSPAINTAFILKPPSILAEWEQLVSEEHF